MDVASLLDDLRRVSEDRVSRRATTQQEVEFARLVNDLARKGTTKADIIRGAKHVPHVGWMDGKAVTVSWLTKDGGKLIVDLVAGADGCERCKPARAPARSPMEAPTPNVTDADVQSALKVFADRRAAKAQKATT